MANLFGFIKGNVEKAKKEAVKTATKVKGGNGSGYVPTQKNEITPTQKNEITPTKYTDIDLSKYAQGYQQSQGVLDALNRKNLAENAVANYGDFTYGNQDAYDRALDAITNRKKFSYDLNADALYQQYKDNYVTQGKQAMMDTMGQAAAMTGGFGNSYAATVGNQTYQGYLQGLNDIIPELHQLALDRYNSEGNELYNKLNVLATDRQTQYGEWGDKLNRLLNERGYYSDDYNNAYNRDYTTWSNNRDYDTSQYWNEYSAGYQKERDAIADAQWQKEFNLAQAEFNLAQEKYRASLKSNSEESLKTPTAEMYDGALNAYMRGGEAGLMQYADKYPEYDYELMFDYATNNWSGVDNVLGVNIGDDKKGQFVTIAGQTFYIPQY